MAELVLVGSFALVSFGCALIYFDKWRKERSEHRATIEEYETLLDDLENKCIALQGCAAHWCNEAIQLERIARVEKTERARWERAYAVTLPKRVN